MDDFDAAAAEASANSVAPDSPPGAPPAAAGISNPAPSNPANAPTAPGPAPAPKPVAVAHFTEEVAVDLIDKGLFALLKRKARRLGLRLNIQDRQALKLSDVERDELLMSVGGVMPYVAQYADLLGKISLAMFGFALWSIYQDKAEMLQLAAEIAARQAQGGPGFAAGSARNGPAPIVPPAAPLNIPAPPPAPGNFDPEKVRGIPVHEPR